MSNTQDSYERGLEDVLAALKILHGEATASAVREVERANYDPRESAKAIGRQDGVLDAYKLVTRMLLDYEAKRAGIGAA